MSLQSQEIITCPGCGKVQKFTCWSSVNVSVDPHLKSALLDSRLTTLSCKDCKNTGHVAHNILYHDMDYPLAVWLKYPDEDGTIHIEKPAAELFELVEGGYICRLVPSFQELAEKVRIFDDGYDDLAIELLKLTICMREGIDITSPFFYDRTERSLLQGKWIVFVISIGDDFAEKRYPAKRSLGALTTILRRLPKTPPTGSDRWVYLNREYVLERMVSVGLMRSLD